MCGVVGMVGLNGRPVDPAVIGRMSCVLRHRGPDDEGTYFSDAVGLGFRRLSILDLSRAGHQPMISPCGQVAIVFNGEIYNYVELRRELESLGHRFQSSGDTEVLLHSYLEWGSGCLSRLNGMWAFLLYDGRRRVLFGSRDRFGKKPLYWHRRADRVLFGSEIKAILASGCYDGGVNWNVATPFFLHNAFFEQADTCGETFYTGISQVTAGAAFELDLHGTWKEWCYWSLADIAQPTVSDPAEAFSETFTDAVRLRLRSDVPVGIFLSGGLDSTSIACTVARLRQENSGGSAGPLLAFSYQDPEFDESRYIGATVRQTGLELVPFRPEPRQLWDILGKVLWYQDEPLHSLVAVITFELSRLASESGVKVILNGGGPDEFLGYPVSFRSYWHTLIGSRRMAAAWHEVSAFHRAHGGSPYKEFGELLVDQLRGAARRAPGVGPLVARRRRRQHRNRGWFTPEFTARFDSAMPSSTATELDRILKHSVEVAPLPYYLRIEDRNSMAHSIEARMPFLDYRLVSLAFQLPSEWKMRGPWNKYVLRAAMRNRIPEVARQRLDKMGFPVPARRWFAGPLHEPIQDLLHSRHVRERGIYNLDAIRRDLGLHKQGRVDVSGLLWRVAQFEVWSKIDNVNGSVTVS